MRDDPVADRRPFGVQSPPGAITPTVDGYTIERELGRGGEAIVYLAHEGAAGRKVAIKVLRPELADSIQSERFLHEIQIVSSLVHPNILTLLGSGRIGGLLYYVTPYVEGESLRRRIEREGQLPVAEAVRIAGEVAYALDYACRHGVVHRDIKPENILLADGHALVADFGIARAVALAGDSSLTMKGIALGTPRYMSPEQAAGEARIDGRSDIYSLGCVLYELLAGLPPFDGVTPQQVLVQHLAAPVPPIRVVRPAVSRDLELMILRALEKVPADRYDTAAEFGEALGGIRIAHPRNGWPSRLVMGAAASALIAGAIWAWPPDLPTSGPATAAGPDTSHYAVVGVNPLTQPTFGDATVEQVVRDALKQWNGITVADLVQVRTALGPRRTALTADEIQAAATAVKAGRVVQLQVSHTADSARIDASLVETRTGQVLADTAISTSRDRSSSQPAIAAMATHLLLGGVVAPARAGHGVGTRSLRARQAFLRGHAALEAWDLARASAEFRAAGEADPSFARAFLWHAQVQVWVRGAEAHWKPSVEKAALAAGRLDASDSLRLDALLARAEGASERECQLWSRLVALDANDFTNRYGLGHCLATDDVVVRDSTSPSRWSFRTSYRRALDEYQVAFRLQPAIHRSFRGGSSEDIRRLFKTNSNQTRAGRAAPPDTGMFAAYPSWTGDSLAFIPVPVRHFGVADRWVSSEEVATAVRKQRELFHETALRWRIADPTSPDALEAVSVALDQLGNRAALDSLVAARTIARDADDRMRMAALEVWIRLKLAAPRNLQGLRAARLLADSLIQFHAPADAAEARQLAGLAALTGKAGTAARFNRIAEAGVAPAAIAQSEPDLIAFASLGGPVDTLRALERELDLAIETRITGVGKRNAVMSLLRAAVLAAPGYRFESIDALSGRRPTERLLLAWRSQDIEQGRKVLEDIRATRQTALVRPPDVTADVLHAEAAIIASLGDLRAAADWLDPTLDSLPLVAPQTLASVARAGPLVRAMVLRADVAAALGDRATAATWARAVIALWSDPDPFLVPTVDRMRTLAR